VTYPVYPAYKEYESIFVSNMPEHWNVKPLYTLCGFRQGKAHEPYVDVDGTYICVNSRFVSTEGKKVKYCTENFTPAYPNDVLMVMSDLPNGRALAKAFYVDGDEVNDKYAVNQRVCALTAQKIASKFLFYQLNRNPYFLMYDDGVNQTHLSNNSFRKYPVLVPSKEEQTQIATFLDRETQKIDRLIEKQQQLIKLLQEKRQAVISYAVTKGLNPNAKMKDSGVEWLGEIPAHWEVKKFNHCASVRNGQVDPTISPYSDMILYAPNHIEKGSGRILYKETAMEQGADSGKYLCKQGEVIYSKIRPALAKISICTEGYALCSADMYPIQAVNGLTNSYLFWLMLSSMFTSEAVLDSDRVAMPKINRDTLGQYKLSVPPRNEQAKISSFISESVNKIDSLVEKAGVAIRLIQERRTALISAAVTGKIDVRNIVNG